LGNRPPTLQSHALISNHLSEHKERDPLRADSLAFGPMSNMCG
jgi:hypothetical protein